MPEDSTCVIGVEVGGTGVLVGGTTVLVGAGVFVGAGVLVIVGVGVGVFGMQLIVTRSGPALSGWSASIVTAVPAEQVSTFRVSVTLRLGSEVPSASSGPVCT